MSEKEKLVVGYALLSIELMFFGYFSLGKILGWF